MIGLRAEERNRVERDPSVEAPAVNGRGKEEAPEEEEDRSRGIVLHRCPRRRDFQNRIEHERQHRRHGDRKRFGKPPDGHEDRHGGAGLAGVREGDRLARGVDELVGHEPIRKKGQHGTRDQGPCFLAVRHDFNVELRTWHESFS